MLSTFMNKKELLLKSIEDELSNELKPLLVSASESGADIFSLDNHNPNKELVSKFICRSNRCLELREELGLELNDTIAYMYLQGHNEAADKNNEHRKGPRRLAAQLLSGFE